MIKSYDDIDYEYVRIRDKNESIRDNNKQELYKKYPKLKEIDSKITKFYIDKGIAYLDDNHNFDANVIDSLYKEKELFLKENNIDKNYNDVKYDCDICKDTGFINGKRCICYKKKEAELINNLTPILTISENVDLENLDYNLFENDTQVLDYNTYKEYIEALIKDLKNNLSNMEDEKCSKNFQIIAEVGRGKTYFALAIAKEFLKNDKSVMYFRINELVDLFFKYKKNEDDLKYDDNTDNVDLKSFAINSDLLIIDDFGTIAFSDYAKQEIDNLIIKRFENKKSTIITDLRSESYKKNYSNKLISIIDNNFYKINLFGDDLRSIKNGR